jgi:uncharacterized protein YjbI with pentapeptide repeats
VKIEIRSRYSNEILFSEEAESLRYLVVAIIKRGADLGGANLGGANLYGADLGGANLGDANLGGANLRGANLGDNVIVQIGPLGSRKDYLIAIHTKGKTEFRAGCFTGSAKVLRDKIETTHGGNHHAQEYRAALDLCDMMLANRIKKNETTSS